MRGWPVALVAAALVTIAIGVAAIVFATRDGSTSIFDLEVGDCFVLPRPDAVAETTFDLELVERIDCSTAHDAEVVATGRLNPGLDRVYPSDAELFAEREYRQRLARRAMELMQAEFEVNTWRACWESVVSDRPAAEIAAELGMTVNAVYLAKSRVLRRLRADLDGLWD